MYLPPFPLMELHCARGSTLLIARRNQKAAGGMLAASIETFLELLG